MCPRPDLLSEPSIFIDVLSLKNILLEKAIDTEPIKDYPAYVAGMSRGASDKMFFLHHIHPDLIVDFGCADGAVLAAIHAKYPDIKLVGYDISPSMEGRFKKNNPDLDFTSNWNEAKREARQFQHSCLLLSSVIHEVYSYSHSKEISQFWKEVFSSGFEYIVIRDTIPKGIDTVKNYKADVEKVKKVVDPVLLADYERKWGNISDSYRTFIRFLMVYRYKHNWDRESVENYMPLTYNTMLDRVPKNYKVIYDKSFKFKPVASSIMKDYGVSVRKNTHLKLILRKS